MADPSVTIQGCAYLVTDTYGKSFTVGKDKSCSCGKEACWHVNQVKRYLNSGGEKAPDAQPLNTEHIETIFTGNNHWTSQDATPTPYQNPYSLAWHATRSSKIKNAKTRMDNDGNNNALGSVGQYWHDILTKTGGQVQSKWNLNEPSFPVPSYQRGS